MARFDRSTLHDCNIVISSLRNATIRDIAVVQGYAIALTSSHIFLQPTTVVGSQKNIAITSGIGDARRITADSTHLYVAYSTTGTIVNRIEKRALATPDQVDATWTLDFSGLTSGQAIPITEIATSDGMPHILVTGANEGGNANNIYTAVPFSKSNGAAVNAYVHKGSQARYSLGAAIDGDNYYNAVFDSGQNVNSFNLLSRLSSQRVLRETFVGGASNTSILANTTRGIAAFDGIIYLATSDSTGTHFRAYNATNDETPPALFVADESQNLTLSSTPTTPRDIALNVQYVYVLAGTNLERWDAPTVRATSVALSGKTTQALTSNKGTPRRITTDDGHVYIIYNNAGTLTLEKRAHADLTTIVYSVTVTKPSAWSGSGACLGMKVQGGHVVLTLYFATAGNKSQVVSNYGLFASSGAVDTNVTSHSLTYNTAYTDEQDRLWFGTDSYGVIQLNSTSATDYHVNLFALGDEHNDYVGAFGLRDIIPSRRDEFMGARAYKGLEVAYGMGWSISGNKLYAFRARPFGAFTARDYSKDPITLRAVEYYKGTAAADDRYIFLGQDATRQNLLIPYNPATGVWEYERMHALNNTFRVKAISVRGSICYCWIVNASGVNQLINYNISTRTEAAAATAFWHTRGNASQRSAWANAAHLSFATRSATEAYIFVGDSTRNFAGTSRNVQVYHVRDQAVSAVSLQTFSSGLSGRRRHLNITNDDNLDNTNDRFEYVSYGDETWYHTAPTSASLTSHTNVANGSWGVGGRAKRPLPLTFTPCVNRSVNKQELVSIPATHIDHIYIMRIDTPSTASAWSPHFLTQPYLPSASTPKQVRAVEYWNRGNADHDRYIFLGSDATRKNIIAPYSTKTASWVLAELTALSNALDVKCISIRDNVLFAWVVDGNDNKIIEYNLGTGVESAAATPWWVTHADAAQRKAWAEARYLSFSYYNSDTVYVLVADEYAARSNTSRTLELYFCRNSQRLVETVHWSDGGDAESVGSGVALYNTSSAGIHDISSVTTLAFDAPTSIGYESANDDHLNSYRDTVYAQWGTGNKARPANPLLTLTAVYNAQAGKHELIAIPRSYEEDLRFIRFDSLGLLASWTDHRIPQPTFQQETTTGSIVVGAHTLATDTTTTLTINFSRQVSGFTASDIVASAGTISNFSGTGATYTATYTAPSTAANVTITIAHTSVSPNLSADVTTTLTVAAVPGQPTHLTTNATNTTIQLNWQPQGAAATGYQVAIERMG